MQEKFYQFNRQDNSKIIQEGLTEVEADVEKKPVPNNDVKPEIVEVSKNLEQAVVTDVERENLFSRLEKPRDILSLPASLRREGLAFLREKIAARYLSVSNMQTAIFDRIDELDRDGLLDIELLKKEVAIKSGQYDFSAEDQKTIDGLLFHFGKDLAKLKEIKDLSEQALLERLIINRSFLPLIKGGYHTRVTPYSIHFNFDNVEDFRLFVSNTEGEAKGEYKHTYGMSYYNDHYPITASGYKSSEDSTFRHEIQHKKFIALTMDRILLDEKAERATRNEVLARFSEHGGPYGIFDAVIPYGFAKKYGIDSVLYEKTLQDALGALQELNFMHFNEKEVLGLLSKEKLTAWPKIVERIKGTKVGKDLIQLRKKKRVKRN